MDAKEIAKRVVKKRFEREGRTFKGLEAMRRELAAAGRHSSEGGKATTLHYRKGHAVKAGEVDCA